MKNFLIKVKTFFTKEELKRRFTPQVIMDLLLIGALFVYLLFPLINMVRRTDRWSPLFFPLWRDFLQYVTWIFLIIAFFVSRLTSGRYELVAPTSVFIKNPAFLFAVGLGIWMIVSTFVTGLFAESIVGSEKSHTGLFYSLVYLFTFFMGLRMKGLRGGRLWIAAFLVLSGILNILIVIDYYAGSKYNLAGSGAVFYNSNHIAYYLLVDTVAAESVFLLAHSRIQRAVALLIYITGFCALFITNTLGCIVAFIVTLVFSAVVLPLTKKWNTVRYISVVLAAVAVTAVLYYVPTVTGKTQKSNIDSNIGVLIQSAEAAQDIESAPGTLGSGRMALWRSAIHATCEKPIFGYGLATMRTRLWTDTHGGNDTVHNEFLEYSSNHGVPALLLYLAFVLAVFIRGARYRRVLTNAEVISLTAAFAYLVSSVFGVTMFYTAPFLFIFLGLGYCRGEESE